MSSEEYRTVSHLFCCVIVDALFLQSVGFIMVIEMAHRGAFLIFQLYFYPISTAS